MIFGAHGCFRRDAVNHTASAEGVCDIQGGLRIIVTAFSAARASLRCAQGRLSPAIFGAGDSAATVRVVTIICEPQQENSGFRETSMNVSKELILSLYRTMAEIREFELKAREIFRSGRMPGFIHLYVGEEAIAAGVIACLRKEDYVTSSHRGHGHALAKGIPAREVMAELMGAVGGCCGGRGGSMHLYDPAVGFLGTNGVVPPGIPIAAGAALSAKLRKTGQVAVAFFGDGAVNNGAFHEALNMAAVWELPVIFV